MKIEDFKFDRIKRKGTDGDYAIYYDRGTVGGDNDLWVQAVNYTLDKDVHWAVLFMKMIDGDVVDSGIYRRLTEEEACQYLIEFSERIGLKLEVLS